jgi:hypothetical protein
VRSGSEEIRQSNCNAYINCYADLYVSSLLALLMNTYTSVYSCVLFILASTRNLKIYFLVPKSSTHTGLDCVKKFCNEYLKLGTPFRVTGATLMVPTG